MNINIIHKFTILIETSKINRENYKNRILHKPNRNSTTNLQISIFLKF